MQLALLDAVLQEPVYFCSLVIRCSPYYTPILSWVIAILSYIEHRLWHRLRLNISSGEPLAALNQLKLHGSPSSNGPVALSRERRKVKEHLVTCSISSNHATTGIEIEPAHHSLCDGQTVCTHWWSTIGPFLLGMRICRTSGFVCNACTPTLFSLVEAPNVTGLHLIRGEPHYSS